MLSSNQIFLRQVINADSNEIMEISYYDGIPASNPNEAIEMQKKYIKIISKVILFIGELYMP
jgi:hypothetical protein